MQPESIVFNEDCMEVMKRYPDNHFDLAIVDPPYGINAPNMTMGSNPNRKGRDKRGEMQYGSVSVAQKLKKGRLNSGGGKLKNRKLNTMNIDWDTAAPGSEYFTELFRVSKNQIIFGGNYFPLPPSRCIICWDKLQPWDNFSQIELAWTSFDKPAKIYRISSRGGANAEEKIHPTQKPVALYDKIYADFVTEGMKILDTHLGSGSHRITAHKANVVFVAAETNISYFNAEQIRFKNHAKATRIQFPVQTEIPLHS